MQMTSRSLVLAIAALATVALAPHSAKADTSVKIPFSFTVAGKAMPAGKYTVLRSSNFGTITLRNDQTSKSYTWVTGPGASDPTDNHVSIKFDELGPDHVLRSIQYGTQSTSRLDTISSRTEDDGGSIDAGR